ncbi:hypothetical protein BKA61DRAFT_682893 [Leptodontidium sp. MPI-SDFR-AT-0119]|nr:hypothetical protein BKA61DRAFT_682893 [Leptodontidium sp. MPI-SDFR-AT-0119]
MLNSNSFIPLSKFTNAAVPTLDSDLVWHTHQLSPDRYINFSNVTARGKFVDLHGNVDNSEIKSDLRCIEDLYRYEFGGEYLVCYSWYCETSRLGKHRKQSDTKYEAKGLLIADERARKLNAGLLDAMMYASRTLSLTQIAAVNEIVISARLVVALAI